MRLTHVAPSLLLLIAFAADLWASPQTAQAAAVADSRLLSADQARRTRYLDLSALPADYQAEAAKVLDLQANNLSRESVLVPLRRVRQDLLAVNLDDYQLSPKVWERFANIDPYFHVQLLKPELEWFSAGYSGGRWYPAGWYKTGRKIKVPASPPWLDAGQVAELIQRTGSQAPILRADWWFVQTARQVSLTNKQTGVGYYDQLGLAKRKDLEKLVVLDEKASRKIGRELRAAVDKSGVADQNRAIERLQSLTGGYWVTEDVKDSTGRGNAVRNLDRRDFVHDAEEIYGVLPNGLFVYWAGNADGTRQDSAPDFIGFDESPLRTGRDGRIHVCLACIRCHTDGLRPIDDWVRRTLRPPLGLQSPDYAKFVELRRQYFSDLDGHLAADRAVYARSLGSLTGWKPAEAAKAYAKLWDWYAERQRGLADIASEVGIDERRWVAALQATAKTGLLDNTLSGLLQNPQSKIGVTHWEEIAPVAFEIARAYKP